MISIKKLAEWYYNHKIARTIIKSSLLLSLTAIVQSTYGDFFEGGRGPKRFQVDQRMLSGKNGLTYSGALKFYGGEKNGVFIAASMGYSQPLGKVTNIGTSLGYIFKFGDKNYVIVRPMLSPSYSLTDDKFFVKPIWYTAGFYNQFLLDPRVIYDPSRSNSTGYDRNNFSYGATLSYGIEQFRVGIDFANGDVTKGQKKILYQIITRVDIEKDENGKPKSWLQFYVGQEQMGLGFRTNF